jgi:galactokinase
MPKEPFLTNARNMPRDNNAVPVSDWLAALAHPERLNAFHEAYGEDVGLIAERAALVRKTLAAFLKRFGDLPVRVFRAPGRINLRGMHVDTHGGYLNLMTHQREVLLVAALSDDGCNHLANTSATHGEADFVLSTEGGTASSGIPWFDFISRPEVRGRVAARRAVPAQVWANYCIGAALRVGYAHPESPPPALKTMAAGDLPAGAALSSSAALSLAALLAFAGHARVMLTTEQLIRAEQDVEWYAGARVGMSDQAAILMGRPGHLLHLALCAEDFNLDTARYYPFPADLDLLVVNSYTARNLSGAQRVQYSLNRFAYSVALPVLRAEMLRAGWDAAAVCRLDRLSRLTPGALGGPSRVYELLKGIPESLDLNTLRERYAPPGLEEAYARYFDGVPTEEQPVQIPLRGPLLFGIAESERARRFPELLLRGDYEQAGALMRIGHDGDRVYTREGKPFLADIDDAALDLLSQANTPLEHCPGWYGASSPALDTLVDAALDGGALGASLTGAGIAGAVLALCRTGDTERVSRALRQCLHRPAYARLAGWAEPPSEEEFETAVMVNRAVSGAGELVPH